MRDDIPTVTFASGITVPAIGIGTWKMGEDAANVANEIRSIQAAIDLGIRVVDTAEMYADGASEKIVGAAIEGRRDEVFLVSKVYPWNASVSGVQQACERSLTRLGTEQIDLYLLHWRGDIALEETVAGMETLRERGLIKSWGVSNFDVEDMQELLAIPGGENCAANQVLYNADRRGIEFDLLPWHQQHAMPLMAYSPLGQGELLRHPEVIRLAKAYQASPAQVALAFVLERDNVLAIPKTAKPERVAELLATLDLDITDEDWAEFDRAFTPPSRKVPLETI
ncbi:aldo/keto reductase [Rhizobium helianthi]|uniref:Aldo/keto reductase n=1 Tax=Rhizobium helianthi TaxID=1132695 RepID=A0ABW4LXJ9_9HYPH